jgi:hypothetical protein
LNLFALGVENMRECGLLQRNRLYNIAEAGLFTTLFAIIAIIFATFFMYYADAAFAAPVTFAAPAAYAAAAYVIQKITPHLLIYKHYMPNYVPCESTPGA